MSEPPPILDYQHPSQEPTRRTTSPVVRFVTGNGLALLAIIAGSTLYGSDDAPGLVCCSAVLWLGVNAGIFALTNFLRAKVSGIVLSERNRWWTMMVGAVSVGLDVGLEALVPQNAAHSALICFVGWVIATGAASWIAMRTVPKTGNPV